MRKITKQVVAAFLNSENFKSGHDEVFVDGNTVTMSYRGNIIASRYLLINVLEVTTAGWNTNTTKDRLNGLPGVNVYTVKGQLFLNGNPWSGDRYTI